MYENVEISSGLVGKELGEDIFLENGSLLLGRGVELTQTHIELLKQRAGRQMIKAGTRKQLASEKLSRMYQQSLDDIKRQFQRLSEGEIPPIHEVKDSYMPLIEQLLKTEHTQPLFSLIEQSDNYTYKHSLNVGIIASIIGKILQLPVYSLALLVEMGIHHDLGKLALGGIVGKEGTLSQTEWKQMKMHTIEGFNLLQKMGEKREDVLYSALLHHERLDGSGYPAGVRGDKIPYLVQIVSVADTYDAITTERHYQRKGSPVKAIQEMMADTYEGRLNPAITVPFARYLMRQYLRKSVNLTNGSRGEVIFINYNEPHQPLVLLENGSVIDLRKNNHITILADDNQHLQTS
ncbi:HD-GYP domain-containing protein [Bacillus marinisedimentorum]|uniref:HD-GYP domain-containing protein n=1 Tax=Bacillus marinisedimentorum TaxID=1821260 RepID=UPI00087293D4|nr:HD domain-containing phosphohydrolase [Bacillus marinisedimentorum]